MYGKNYSAMVLELNASDDRGIDVVRDQIKEFASTRQMFSSAPKLIVLDEADNMTSAAQFALRRVIEKFTRNARFCLICNYASKIIPALQSRCTRFRFAPLQPEQALGRIKVVCEEEGVSATEDGLDACIKLGTGDMRKCLNILQSTHMSFGKVDAANVYTCTGAPHPTDVDTILGYLLQEDFVQAFNHCWDLMSAKGLAVQDVVTELHTYVVEIDAAQPMAKASLVASLSDLEARLAVGTSDKIQLGGLVGLFQASRASLCGA
jgi:replication factor C subunit 3/5